MLDGAGQVLNARVKGRRCVQTGGQRSVLIHFLQKPQLLAQTRDHRPVASDHSHLIFVENPDYQNEGPVRAPAPLSVLVTREEGPFPFVRHVTWHIRHAEDWPRVRDRRVYKTSQLSISLR